MPKEASAHMGSDAFNQAKRCGSKFGPRSSECHVPMKDGHLDAIFNPQAKDGGTHSTDEYPRASGNYGDK